MLNRAWAIEDFQMVSFKGNKKMIDDSLAFLDAAIENRQVQKTALDDFAKQMTPVLLANVDEAARVELDALHSHVSEATSIDAG